MRLLCRLLQMVCDMTQSRDSAAGLIELFSADHMQAGKARPGGGIVISSWKTSQES